MAESNEIASGMDAHPESPSSSESAYETRDDSCVVVVVVVDDDALLWC